MKTRILIGIPSVKPKDYFLESLSSFLSELDRTEVSYEVKWVRNKSLVEAQNILSEYTIENDYSHLLFLEDDHSGHTVAMLQALIESDKPVIAIPYYSRYDHMPKIPMMRRGNKFVEGHFTEGINKVDLVGFGMTLIKREVLEKLDKPHFIVNDYECIDKSKIRSTDRKFCERVGDVYGHYDYHLSHRGIDKSNVLQHRIKFLENRTRKVLHNA